MFNKPTFSDFFRIRFSSVKSEIAQKGDEYLVSVDIEEFINYLVRKFEVSPIVIDPTKMHLEKIRRTHKIKNAFDEDVQIEDLFAKITIPILRNEEAHRIFEYIPSSYSLTLPKVTVSQEWISIETPASEGGVEMVINGLKSDIATRNRDIEQGNIELRRKIEEFFRGKRSQLEKEQELLESISKKVSIPLKQKAEISSIVPTAIKYNQVVKPIAPPQPNPPKEYFLERDKFNAIINLIDNSCRMFERTPLTFSKFEEEELRNVILSNLNGVFDGSAVGEAFSKNGKTDIYLPINKGSVFIAECKYWKGIKALSDAVQQILGYLTWRNSFGVLVIFSNRKNFSDVLSAIQENITETESYASGKEKIAENHVKTFHYLPEDKNKQVEIHTLAYNLYCELIK